MIMVLWTEFTSVVLVFDIKIVRLDLVNVLYGLRSTLRLWTVLLGVDGTNSTKEIDLLYTVH